MNFNFFSSSKRPNADESQKWGTRAWFKRQAKGDADSPASYFAYNVNGFQRFRHAKLALFLKEQLPIPALHYILDVGCAGGIFLSIVNKTLQPRSAIGIDFIEKIIHQGHHRYQDISFTVASLPNIPIKKGSVDLVIASEVLYYLTEKEQKLTIQKIHNILSPGGYFFFTSTIGEKYFSESSACALIAPYFEILTVKYLNLRLYKKLISIPYRIVRFDDLICKGEEPGNEKFNRYFKKLKFAVDNPLGRIVLGTAGYVFRKFLSSVSFPAACEAIGQRFSTYFQSNIVILAQRRSEN
jgi:ubiquinone/menaquinone biosynthesis C-methylase UbiE